MASACLTVWAHNLKLWTIAWIFGVLCDLFNLSAYTHDVLYHSCLVTISFSVQLKPEKVMSQVQFLLQLVFYSITCWRSDTLTFVCLFVCLFIFRSTWTGSWIDQMLKIHGLFLVDPTLELLVLGSVWSFLIWHVEALLVLVWCLLFTTLQILIYRSMSFILLYPSISNSFNSILFLAYCWLSFWWWGSLCVSCGSSFNLVLYCRLVSQLAQNVKLYYKKLHN